MESGIITRLAAPAILALSLVLSISWGALFEAPGPGERLQPVGGASELVTIDQAADFLRWNSQAGVVSWVTITDWPVTIDGEELGGALRMEAVDAGSGVITLHETPRTLFFEG